MKAKIIITVSIFMVLTVFGWACSQTNSGSDDKVNSQSINKVKVLSTKNIILATTETYQTQLLKFQSPSLTSYWQLVKTNKPSQGTIVYSVPYEGIDWSGEEVDKRWAADPRSATGYFAPDVDGPDYNSATSKQVSFRLAKLEDIANQGIFFLYNGYDVLFVHHRFYAGRTTDLYVEEMRLAIEWLQTPVAVFGVSLGGFISLQAAGNFGPELVKAQVIMSPLSNWQNQKSYLDGLSAKISNPTKLAEYIDFFEPYVRRFANPAVLQSPKRKISTLLIHDEWDTLIPVEQSDQLFSGNILATDSQYLKFQHLTPVDFNTMVKEHYQPGSGLNFTNTIPYYQAFIFNRLRSTNSSFVIFYNESTFTALLNEMKNLKANGKDTSGFQKVLSELCKPNFLMYDMDAGNQPTVEAINLINSKNSGFTCAP